MSGQKTRILAIVDYYLPGFKFGGPGRALANIADNLGESYDLRIITRDRDHDDPAPYPDIKPNCWQNVGNAQVCYIKNSDFNISNLRRLITESKPDVVYLNSLWSPRCTTIPLLARRLKLLPKAKFIVAPRGELAPGALEINRMKKQIFLSITKAIGLYSGIVMQALSEKEEKEIRIFFRNTEISIAREITFLSRGDIDITGRREKVAGKLKLLFLSRISRLKNLPGALEILKEVDSEVEFNIYGPNVEPEEWVKCERLISQMPENVHVNYHGGVKHDHVLKILKDHDLFFLPTISEGSATAVLEAMAAGCPVLISDNTPYRGLESLHAGWDIPLTEPERFRNAIRQCAEMDQATHMRWSQSARDYARKLTNLDYLSKQYAKLFS